MGSPFERALLSFGGLGRLGVAPGTFGSLGAALLIFAVSNSGAGEEGEHAFVFCLALLGFGVVTCLAWAGSATSAKGDHDPGWVVADEVAGQAIASAVIVHTDAWAAHLLAFVLFRVFDISKPPGVRHAERLPGGAGVLVDDVVAGLYAAALTWVGWTVFVG